MRTMKKKKKEIYLAGVGGLHFRFFCWRIDMCPFCGLISIERIKKRHGSN